jgi:carbamoyltransferase
MIRWGITANSHDASIAVFDGFELKFAAHSERTSRIKNDPSLNEKIITQAMNYGHPNEVHWYETEWLKKTRQVYAGQWHNIFKDISPEKTLFELGINNKIEYHRHHSTHAAAGWYTSPFDSGAVLVIDSIGEWETLTMWTGKGNLLTKQFSQKYPNSIGLWYSAMTQRVGLKPNEEEYILMGMAAVGNPKRFFHEIFKDFFYPLESKNLCVRLKHNLHRGCNWWKPELTSQQDLLDIAAGTQAVYEFIFEHLIKNTQKITQESNIVLMGGCSLNCVANGIAFKYFKNVWIMPNPGDSGSSVGAVLDHLKTKIEYVTPYLGYNINGNYPIKMAIEQLTNGGIVGIANGAAEFGPRSLGNRSLIADPRGQKMKDLVNSIKRRQSFRPFAPVIKEEKLHDYFTMPVGCNSSPYMQFVGVCKYPEKFPAITHLDGTSRVQTVNSKQHPGLYQLLTKWESITNCPILLNTSLNIKGEPIVDSEDDAIRWSNKYNIKIALKD